MKLLLDENVHSDLVRILEEHGHDVTTGALTVTDDVILTLAVQENRILITHDRDFGELIFRFGHEHRGVLYLRLADTQPDYIGRRIQDALAAGYPENSFLIVRPSTIRVRAS